MMLPRVNLLKVVSVNGGIKGFERDLEEESMILSQIKITFDSYLIDIHSLKRLSDIIPDDVLEQPKPDFQGLDDPRSKLIVIDPEGKMDDWERISKIPVWSERFALVTNNTPSSYLEELDKYSVGHILMGEDKFDMVAVLKELYENFDCGEILIDVPGDISGELVKEGYVDEINLIVYPCIVDDEKGHFLDLPNLSNKIA
ncbi:MAG: dihydrofolate reductase family protein, partial [Candidatus Thermoplasmatota archaeon]|nr:dihydrofolate reductase family protein [Candidatus Thermoplasmatota archaeon]